MTGQRRPGYLATPILLLLISTTLPAARAQTQPSLPGNVAAIFAAETDPVWSAFSSGQFKPGSDRVIGEGQLFVPLFQDSETLLFTDIRGQLADDENREGNFGLGLRRMFDREWILGGYAFYDRRRTQFGNDFDQATIGGELLSLDWEARVNGYLPNNTGRTVSGGTAPTAVFSGGSIVLQGGAPAVERPYYGVDAEVGSRLLSWGSDAELRGFLGGFHFDNNNAGYRNISGPRSRLELRFYDLEWLKPGSRVVLAGEMQWDAVRDTTSYGILQVRIPLGAGRRSCRKLSAIERRMVDRVVRDVDIVTNHHAPSFSSEPVVDPVTGAPLGPVTIVDANTADVPLAVSAAGSGSVIFVDGSQGTISVTNTIVAQSGQTIVGGGQTIQIRGATTNALATLTTPGIRPFVTRSDSAGSVLEVVSLTTVRGLDIEGGLNGIAGPATTSLTDLQIIDNHISLAADAGVLIDGNVDGSILNNTFSRNGAQGFRSADVNGFFTGNTASMNGDTGFETGDIDAQFSDNLASRNDGPGFDAGDVRGTFSGNTAERNMDDGFYLGDIDGTFTNNTAVRNDGWGFDTDNVTGVFSGNHAESNVGDGFYLDDINGTFTNNVAILNQGWGFDLGDITGTFSGNRAEANEDEGFDTDDIDGVFTNNVATGNGSYGFITGDILGTFSDNTATANGDAGFDLGDIDGTFSGNTATDNSHSGFDLGDIDGTFSTNTAARNLGYGFDTGDVLGTFSGNSSFDNSEDGFYTGDIDATFSNNTAARNLGWGFDVGDVDGVFSGNTATDNGNHGFDIDDIDGSVTTNTSTGNQGHGFRVGDIFGNFSSNSAVNNWLNGYNVGTNFGTASGNTGSNNAANNQYP